MARPRKNGNGKKLNSPGSVNAAVKAICDIMRRSNCAGALQYVPELTWLLFLRILDENEIREAERSEAVVAEFSPALETPYRWRDWASPEGAKRKELQAGTLGAFFGFVNGELLPYLRGLRERPNASARQKIISEIMSGVEKVRIDTEKNLLDVLDRVDDIKDEAIGPDGRIDILRIRPLARLGYYDYTSVESIFEMVIPDGNEALLAGLEGKHLK